LNILVTAKRVTDYDSKITPTADGKGIDYDQVDFKMNPFCEIAVEEAIQIAESADDAEIIVLPSAMKRLHQRCEKHSLWAHTKGF
jgi:electron transfer flavoprotein beta subunit